METHSFFDKKGRGTVSEFLHSNTETGILKIKVSALSGVIPLEGKAAVVYKDFDDGRWIFFSGKTDSSGIIDDIELPAPPYRKPTRENVAGAFAVYAVMIDDMNGGSYISAAEIFSGIKTIKPYDMSVGGRE